jgi:formamidopyrimidine-DNA glycosylase
MPELPEVETVKLGIQGLTGQHITNVVVRQPRLRYMIEQDFTNTVVTQKVRSITRRAKYLLLNLDNGHIIIHLGMSGSIILSKTSELPDLKKHDHVDIVFDTHTLRYNDPRRFGLIMYSQDLTACNLLKQLGVEPLSPEFNPDYLMDKIKHRKSPIKQLIMTNQIVVGVGNIYACEALFRSKILPTRPGNSLTIAEVNLLITNIKDILNEAIKLGGSSLRDYKHANGDLGYFQNAHKAYGKAGKACSYCSSIILAKRLGQRNSFYCPSCQI